MQEEESHISTDKSKSNRPHCLYLWFIRGKAVCSEENQHRNCAYPFWNCPARKGNNEQNGIEEISEDIPAGITSKEVRREMGSA